MKSGRIQYLRFLRHVTVLTLLCAGAGFGQASDKIISVGPNEAKEGAPLTIQAELAKAGVITQMLLAYRPFGASEYKKVEMTINLNTASATIPGGEVAPSAIDYYLLVGVRGVDTLQPYPLENPEGNPLQVQVRTENPKDKMVIFLSPEPNTSVRSDDLLISISLYRTPSSVNRKATKIYIDDRDVTSSAGFIEDIVTLSPENIKPPLSDGPHNIKVELFDNEGKLYYSSGMSFAQESITEAEVQTTKLNYKVSGQLESRNETISDVSTPYNRGTLNLTSEYGPLKVNGGLYLTNEDRDDRQPQNRYSVEALTSWLRVGYGDAYPTFPSLIMSGKRLRGLTSNLKLGFFNLDFATGETVRRIEGDTVYSFPKDSLLSQQLHSNGPFAPVGSDSSRYALYRYGTFTRNLTVIRPSFGSGQAFQWGFSYLKAKDDTNSIVYGFKPQENVALGTDLFVGLDDRRIEFTAQGAASVINQDIKPGNLSNDDIDSLYKFKTGTEASAADSQDVIKKRNDLKDIKDKISPFITVNQNLIPLSIDKITSVMAYEGALALNYFDNYLKGSYIFRGSEYNSFGQTYVRNDVQGYNVFDRIRLIESQLFLSVGVEQLKDNTDGNKNATTTFLNDNATVSYFPRSNFPNITIGYSLNKNSNDLIGSDTTGVVDSSAHAKALQGYLSAIEDKTDRFFIQLGYAFTAGVRHNASLTISTSDRNDRTFRHNDANNTFISGSLNTTWNSPLQTMFGFSVNLNQLPKLDPNDSTHQTFILSDFNYSSIILNARYPFLENRLMLSGTISPTFGDFNRMVWDVAADYSIRKDLVVSFQMSLFQNSASSTDVIGSLMLKYNM